MSIGTALVYGTRQEVYCEAIGGTLIVSSCSWSKETADAFGDAAIIAGQVPVDEYTATQDGKAVRREWHGPDDGEVGEDVYYERYARNARVAHGWIDAGSRKIVQAG